MDKSAAATACRQLAAVGLAMAALGVMVLFVWLSFGVIWGVVAWLVGLLGGVAFLVVLTEVLSPRARRREIKAYLAATAPKRRRLGYAMMAANYAVPVLAAFWDPRALLLSFPLFAAWAWALAWSVARASREGDVPPTAASAVRPASSWSREGT